MLGLHIPATFRDWHDDSPTATWYAGIAPTRIDYVACSRSPHVEPVAAGTLPDLDLLETRVDHVPAFLRLRIGDRERGASPCTRGRLNHNRQLLGPGLAAQWGPLLAQLQAPAEVHPHAHEAFLANRVADILSQAAPVQATPKDSFIDSDTWDLICARRPAKKLILGSARWETGDPPGRCLRSVGRTPCCSGRTGPRQARA